MVQHKTHQTDSPPRLDDAALNLKVKRLQTSIKKWAQENDLWGDCGFKTWIEHYDSPPHAQNPCVFLLWFEGNLCTLFNGYGFDTDGLMSQFSDLIENSDFEWEIINHTTVGFWAKEIDLQKAYAEMLTWRWTSSLIAPEYSLIHEFVFDFFSTNDGSPVSHRGQRPCPKGREDHFARASKIRLGAGKGAVRWMWETSPKRGCRDAKS